MRRRARSCQERGATFQHAHGRVVERHRGMVRRRRGRAALLPARPSGSRRPAPPHRAPWAGRPLGSLSHGARTPCSRSASRCSRRTFAATAARRGSGAHRALGRMCGRTCAAWSRGLGPSGPALPLFLLGNSLGGLVVLDYALHHPDRHARRHRGGAAARRRSACRAAARAGPHPLPVWPRFSLETGMDLTGLARDPAVAREVLADPLFHRRGTARLSTEVTATIARVQARAPGFPCPVLVLHGAADRMVPPDGSRRFVARVGRPRRRMHRVSRGAYHALLADLDQRASARGPRGWIVGRTSDAALAPIRHASAFSAASTAHSSPAPQSQVSSRLPAEAPSSRGLHADPTPDACRSSASPRPAPARRRRHPGRGAVREEAEGRAQAERRGQGRAEGRRRTEQGDRRRADRRPVRPRARARRRPRRGRRGARPAAAPAAEAAKPAARPHPAAAARPKRSSRARAPGPTTTSSPATARSTSTTSPPTRWATFPSAWSSRRARWRSWSGRGRAYLRASQDSKFYLTLPEILPERFTMEFDYSIPTGGEVWISFGDENKRVQFGGDGTAAVYNQDTKITANGQVARTSERGKLPSRPGAGATGST